MFEESCTINSVCHSKHLTFDLNKTCTHLVGGRARDVGQMQEEWRYLFGSLWGLVRSVVWMWDSRQISAAFVAALSTAAFFCMNCIQQFRTCRGVWGWADTPWSLCAELTKAAGTWYARSVSLLSKRHKSGITRTAYTEVGSWRVAGITKAMLIITENRHAAKVVDSPQFKWNCGIVTNCHVTHHWIFSCKMTVRSFRCGLHCEAVWAQDPSSGVPLKKMLGNSVVENLNVNPAVCEA